MTNTFHHLGVDQKLCDELEAKGITHPFPIQELTLPLALAGNDLIGQARTGTGKTLAFGLPLLQRIDPRAGHTQALIVVPTRELCVQVHDDLRIGTALGITSVSVYGGVPYEEQIDLLTSGAHVVVGTPGRLIDHLNRGNLELGRVSELVLDEADEMLDMGFLPDVERLLEACPGEGRHTMLFSATMPTEIVKLGRRYMHHPTFTRAESDAADTAPTVEQHFFQVHRMDKPRVLARILQAPGRKGVLVFVRTKHMADRLVNELAELDTDAIPIHGDLRQATRERNLLRFRSGKANVLVATEVAARGLDITDVTHVVNYDCPDDDKMYLHRIGRTARAGQDGAAITFAEHHEVSRLGVIRKAVGTQQEVVEVFSTSDELTRRFDLPAQTPWGHLAASGSTGPSGGGNGSARGDRPKRDRKPRERADGHRKPRERADGHRKPRERADGHRKPREPAENATPPTADAVDDHQVRTRKRSRERGSHANPSPAAPTGEAKRTRDNDHAKPREGQRARGGTKGSGKQRASRARSGSQNVTKGPQGPDEHRPVPEKIEAGATARGGGQPQPARQVKVEHLP